VVFETRGRSEEDINGDSLLGFAKVSFISY